MDGRSPNKTYLQEKFELEINPNLPLLAAVMRVDHHQKGLGLLVHPLPGPLPENLKSDIYKICDKFNLSYQQAAAIVHSPLFLLAKMGAQVIIHGAPAASDEDGKVLARRIETVGRAINAVYPGSAHMQMKFESRPEEIFAGADLGLNPSFFEPFGIVPLQQSAMGCVPIVRATGGFVDNFSHFDLENLEGNAFVFHDFSASALFETVSNAIHLHQSDPLKWRILQLNAIRNAKGFHWERQARRLLEIIFGKDPRPLQQSFLSYCLRWFSRNAPLFLFAGIFLMAGWKTVLHPKNLEWLSWIGFGGMGFFAVQDLFKPFFSTPPRGAVTFLNINNHRQMIDFRKVARILKRSKKKASARKKTLKILYHIIPHWSKKWPDPISLFDVSENSSGLIGIREIRDLEAEGHFRRNISELEAFFKEILTSRSLKDFHEISSLRGTFQEKLKIWANRNGVEIVPMFFDIREYYLFLWSESCWELAERFLKEPHSGPENKRVAHDLFSKGLKAYSQVINRASWQYLNEISPRLRQNEDLIVISPFNFFGLDSELGYDGISVNRFFPDSLIYPSLLERIDPTFLAEKMDPDKMEKKTFDQFVSRQIGIHLLIDFFGDPTKWTDQEFNKRVYHIQKFVLKLSDGQIGSILDAAHEQSQFVSALFRLLATVGDEEERKIFGLKERGPGTGERGSLFGFEVWTELMERAGWTGQPMAITLELLLTLFRKAGLLVNPLFRGLLTANGKAGLFKIFKEAAGRIPKIGAAKIFILKEISPKEDFKFGKWIFFKRGADGKLNIFIHQQVLKRWELIQSKVHGEDFLLVAFRIMLIHEYLEFRGVPHDRLIKEGLSLRGNLKDWLSKDDLFRKAKVLLDSLDSEKPANHPEIIPSDQIRVSEITGDSRPRNHIDPTPVSVINNGDQIPLKTVQFLQSQGFLVEVFNFNGNPEQLAPQINRNTGLLVLFGISPSMAVLLRAVKRLFKRKIPALYLANHYLDDIHGIPVFNESLPLDGLVSIIDRLLLNDSIRSENGVSGLHLHWVNFEIEKALRDNRVLGATRLGNRTYWGVAHYGGIPGVSAHAELKKFINRLAEIHFNQGHLWEAIFILEEAVSVFEDREEFWELLKKAYENLGNWSPSKDTKVKIEGINEFSNREFRQEEKVEPGDPDFFPDLASKWAGWGRQWKGEIPKEVLKEAIRDSQNFHHENPYWPSYLWVHYLSPRLAMKYSTDRICLVIDPSGLILDVLTTPDNWNRKVWVPFLKRSVELKWSGDDGVRRAVSNRDLVFNPASSFQDRERLIWSLLSRADHKYIDGGSLVLGANPSHIEGWKNILSESHVAQFEMEPRFRLVLMTKGKKLEAHDLVWIGALSGFGFWGPIQNIFGMAGVDSIILVLALGMAILFSRFVWDTWEEVTQYIWGPRISIIAIPAGATSQEVQRLLDEILPKRRAIFPKRQKTMIISSSKSIVPLREALLSSQLSVEVIVNDSAFVDAADGLSGPSGGPALELTNLEQIMRRRGFTFGRFKLFVPKGLIVNVNSLSPNSLFYDAMVFLVGLLDTVPLEKTSVEEKSKDWSWSRRFA